MPDIERSSVDLPSWRDLSEEDYARIVADVERLRATLETAKQKLIEVRSQAGTALDAIAKAEHDLNAS